LTDIYETGGREFAIDFINYFEKEGINDEFDKKTQKMVPSPGVLALVRQAKAIFPERMPDDGHERNKVLPEDERQAAIDAGPTVVDMQKVFARRMAVNKGAQGLLMQLAEAGGDSAKVAELLDQAKEFAEWQERGDVH
jgi:hypothetical protein